LGLRYTIHYLPVDRQLKFRYTMCNSIGQFVTILSVNKTREFDGRTASIFCGMGADCAHFSVSEELP